MSCGGNTPTAPSTPGGATSSQLRVSAPQTLLVGQTGKATATKVDPRDGAMAGEAVAAVWQSSNPAVISVSADGTVGALARGTAQITATYQGISGAASTNVFADSDIIAVEITCPATLLLGQQLQCVVSTRLAGGIAIPVITADWSSSNPAIVTVYPQGSVLGRSGPVPDTPSFSSLNTASLRPTAAS
jgi:hypothetical protein